MSPDVGDAQARGGKRPLDVNPKAEKTLIHP